MNRRKFLATLFGAGAALAVGPSLLALVPKPAPLPLPPPMFWSTELSMPIGLDEQLLLDRYLAPAAQAMAEAIDADLIALFQRSTSSVRLVSEAACACVRSSSTRSDNRIHWRVKPWE